MGERSSTWGQRGQIVAWTGRVRSALCALFLVTTGTACDDPNRAGRDGGPDLSGADGSANQADADPSIIIDGDGDGGYGDGDCPRECGETCCETNEICVEDQCECAPTSDSDICENGLDDDCDGLIDTDDEDCPCGNGVLQDDESCDDGNNRSGDGCSAACAAEDGYDCQGQPSTCSSCTDALPLVFSDADCNLWSFSMDTGVNFYCGDGSPSSGGIYIGANYQQVSGGATGTASRQVDLADADELFFDAEAYGRDVHAEVWIDDALVWRGPSGRQLSGVTLDVSGYSGVHTLALRYVLGIKRPGSHALRFGATGCRQASTCGTEICDDGIDNDCDALADDDDPECQWCGDGRTDWPEQCDDGNRASDDGCSDECELESGWVCDDSRPTQCVVCGDGLIELGEVCDDGNGDSGDGCDSTCQVEPGWSCALSMPSQCDECGNGLIGGNENCDDDNTDGGDGCSRSCRVESWWQCDGGEPSTCVRPTYSVQVNKAGSGYGTVRVSVGHGPSCSSASSCAVDAPGGLYMSIGVTFEEDRYRFGGWSGGGCGPGGWCESLSGGNRRCVMNRRADRNYNCTATVEPL